MSSKSASWRAGKLLQFALRVGTRPAQDDQYRELLTDYFDDSAFRETVKDVAAGMGLIVVDASDHGLVLEPEDGSVFSMSPSEFRKTNTVEERLLLGLVQIGIAATVFPRARDLEEDLDLARPPIRVDDVEEMLRTLCELFAKDSSDPRPADEEDGLTEAWRIYLRRQDVFETASGRRDTRGTRRAIEATLERLRELGCFVERTENNEPCWQPTRRYQVLVQRYAATRLHARVREVLGDAGAR